MTGRFSNAIGVYISAVYLSTMFNIVSNKNEHHCVSSYIVVKILSKV